MNEINHFTELRSNLDCRNYACFVYEFYRSMVRDWCYLCCWNFGTKESCWLCEGDERINLGYINNRNI